MKTPVAVRSPWERAKTPQAAAMSPSIGPRMVPMENSPMVARMTPDTTYGRRPFVGPAVEMVRLGSDSCGSLRSG